MQYPHVSKSLRGIFGKDKNHHHKESGHCCGMMAMAEQGLGYPDLDDLVKNPQPLEFTLGRIYLLLISIYKQMFLSMIFKFSFQSLHVTVYIVKRQT